MCGLFVLVQTTSLWGQSRELQDLSVQLAQKITSSGKKSVAVVDFTDLQGNVTELGRFLAEELSIAISQHANGFRVIDRTYLKAILREHKLAASGLIDPATASKLGQISGVQGLITGTIVPLGDNVSLSVKVLDAASEAIIAATMTQIPKTPTINALLSTSVAGGSGSTGSTAGASSSTSDGGQRGGTTQEVHASYQGATTNIVVRQCRRRGGMVECFGAVTDTASGPETFWIGQTYMLDNLGNQYNVGPAYAGAMKVGTYGDRQNIEPGLPMNFYLAVEKVDSTASSINIVMQCGTYGQGITSRQGTVTLRHIPIGGR